MNNSKSNVTLNKRQAGFGISETMLLTVVAAIMIFGIYLTIPYAVMTDKLSTTTASTQADQQSAQVTAAQDSPNAGKKLSDTYLAKKFSTDGGVALKNIIIDLALKTLTLVLLIKVSVLVVNRLLSPDSLKDNGNSPSPSKEELPSADIPRLIEAQATLDAIKLTSDTIINNEIKAQINRVISASNAVLDKLKADPENLAKSGKFINIYLTGIGRVVDGYAKIQKEPGSQAFELRLKDALSTAEALCMEQRQKLFDPDRFNLDVHLDVLAQQMKYEGL